MTSLGQVIVPYPASNSTVRTRALHWIDRASAAGQVKADDIVVHGPGFPKSTIERDRPTLLVRNARRVTRGRSESRLLRAGSPGVYDLDDGLPWDNGNLPGLGHWTKRPFPRSLLAKRAASSADRVIAGNDVLADWAADHCADVRVIPTCIEPSDYSVRSDWAIGGAPRLGWIGSPATEGYLIDIAAGLAEIHRRTGARLEIVSGPGEVPAVLEPFTERTLWSTESTRHIAAWDIGLMPLRDGVYERAKCGYKLLQYAASGVPVVASPVGVSQELLTAMDGVAPETASDWVDAVCSLIEEPAARRASRATSGFAVATAYSYDNWHDAFIDAVGWLS
ncbi:MAG TPA: glycosyltransferase [Ilumatobacter sp.]|nr:glycosyltransferase [Ilumatobacter sp.]